LSVFELFKRLLTAFIAVTSGKLLVPVNLFGGCVCHVIVLSVPQIVQI